MDMKFWTCKSCGATIWTPGKVCKSCQNCQTAVYVPPSPTEDERLAYAAGVGCAAMRAAQTDPKNQ